MAGTMSVFAICVSWLASPRADKHYLARLKLVLNACIKVSAPRDMHAVSVGNLLLAELLLVFRYLFDSMDLRVSH